MKGKEIMKSKSFQKIMAIPLFTLVIHLTISSASSHAFEQIINFESGDTSGVYVYLPQNTSLVPSTLTGGGNYAFRCMIPQGQDQTYCGISVGVTNLPQLTDLYVRYYVKFEPSWLFSVDNPYFKSMITEVNVANYTAGGRSFINFNSRSQTEAEIVYSCYSNNAGQLQPTGITIRNDNQWHSIESRVVKNLASPANGRFQLWFDGRLVFNLFPFNTGDALPASLTFGYRNGAAQRDMYMQYDEIVIADHYIGPIGAPTDTPPSPPTNLQILN